MKIKIESPVAVLGYGVEGKAAVAFLKNQGIKDITVCDENPDTKIPDGLKSKLGSDAFENLEDFKTIIRSPSVRYSDPNRVTSMTELALDAGREKITAVTGSNGKTTTVGMLEAILKKHYQNKIIVGGNDRQPVLEEVLAKPDWPVLMEVSSFQFADLHKSPHISAILNITPNHLDWHENLEEYAHAKTNLIAHQKPEDWCVLNAGDENSTKLGSKTPSRIFWLNTDKGNDWVSWKEDKLIAKYKEKEIEILKKEDLNVKTHPDNILCAAAISLIHEVAPEMIKEVLQNFKGVEHRLEFVREINGIKFYNDSACTTPESAKMAIDQFPEGNLILLLGGSSKNGEFSFLAHHIIETDTRVVLYGEEGPRIKKALEDENGEYLILHEDSAGDFESIIKTTLQKAGPNYNIVLSPACASFDMFKNSKDRGKQFKEIVKSL
jgi:UDP-N-acetylmuramoylalanine--D-glutamate ligase